MACAKGQQEINGHRHQKARNPIRGGPGIYWREERELVADIVTYNAPVCWEALYMKRYRNKNVGV